MQYGQLQVGHVFATNQGIVSPEDILISGIMPMFFMWTGIPEYTIFFVLISALILTRAVQPKGKKKSFNIFIINWIITKGQQENAGFFIKKTAERMCIVYKQFGCVAVTDPVRYRP